MHVLPRVRELHERFSDVLSVVGVHAGKFSTERRTERIASAADRLGVTHAIVNDRQFRIWKSYAVEAWPTIALIDPEGYLIGIQSGEFDTEAVAEIIERVTAEAERRGTLVRGDEPFLRVEKPEGGLLRYPSRVIESEGRLYVADAGHGRLVEIELGESGLSGRVRREWTGFLEPQGVAVDSTGGAVWVADRAGHAVWRLDTASGARERVAGTGAIAHDSIRPGSLAAATPIRSPWGLLLDGTRLLLSMAGSHQLFSISLDTGVLELVAGSGGEAVLDGPARGAALAQPTGLCASAGGVVFTDCESSAVRRVDADDALRTIVGTGLFDFGDRDGVADQVLLQHCQDVAWHDGFLAVADTYNDRIKRIDPATRTCEPWPGAAGRDGELREPGGVSASTSGGLVIADTGNHRIVRVGVDGSLAPIEIEER